MGKKQRTPAKAKASERKIVTIALPFAETGGYIGRRLDLRMSLREAMAYRCVFDGLRAEHATLPGGRHVDRGPDVIR